QFGHFSLSLPNRRLAGIRDDIRGLGRGDSITRTRTRTTTIRRGIPMDYNTGMAEMEAIENSRPGYKILTWGCQMNEEESEQMALYLEEMGYAPVDDPAQADVVLLNTCHVRQKPVDKVYSKLGELREM